jgi:hypothetical protein
MNEVMNDDLQATSSEFQQFTAQKADCELSQGQDMI